MSSSAPSPTIDTSHAKQYRFSTSGGTPCFHGQACKYDILLYSPVVVARDRYLKERMVIEESLSCAWCNPCTLITLGTESWYREQGIHDRFPWPHDMFHLTLRVEVYTHTAHVAAYRGPSCCHGSQSVDYSSSCVDLERQVRHIYIIKEPSVQRP